MTRRFAFLVALPLLGLLVTASPGAAQTWRAYVSETGVDAGSCPVSAPCRSLNYALQVSNNNGEIVVRGPYVGVFPGFAKSITVTGDGPQVDITNGQIVSTPGQRLHFRHLQLNGHGLSNSPAVRVWVAATVILEDVTIRGFPFAVHVDNGEVIVTRSTITQNGTGLSSSGGTLTVDRTVVTGNGVGVQAIAAGTVRLTDANIFGNTTNILCGGNVVSFGNNRVAGGGGCGPASVLPQQ